MRFQTERLGGISFEIPELHGEEYTRYDRAIQRAHAQGARAGATLDWFGAWALIRRDTWQCALLPDPEALAVGAAPLNVVGYVGRRVRGAVERALAATPADVELALPDPLLNAHLEAFQRAREALVEARRKTGAPEPTQLEQNWVGALAVAERFACPRVPEACAFDDTPLDVLGYVTRTVMDALARAIAEADDPN